MLSVEAETGKPTAALDAKPQLFEDLGGVWEGFISLSGSRSYHDGIPQSIQYQELRAYMELREIQDPEEQEEFVLMVRELDALFVKHVCERRERAIKERQRRGRP